MAFNAVNRIAGRAVEGLFPPWLRRARTIEPFSLSVQGHSRNLHAQATSAFLQEPTLVAAQYLSLRANQRDLGAAYSITSSVTASILSGTRNPSVLAVLRLMTRSNLVGCSIGKSPGLAPFRILST